MRGRSAAERGATRSGSGVTTVYGLVPVSRRRAIYRTLSPMVSFQIRNCGKRACKVIKRAGIYVEWLTGVRQIAGCAFHSLSSTGWPGAAEAPSPLVLMVRAP
jgi:hypothetical protein